MFCFSSSIKPPWTFSQCAQNPLAVGRWPLYIRASIFYSLKLFTFFSIFHIIQNSRLRASFHITSGHRYFEAAHFYALWRFPLIFLWWFSNISPWLHHTVSWPFETSKQRRNKKVVKKPHRNYYPRDGNFRLPSYFFILWSNWVRTQTFLQE